jgi:hypothetical protein
MNISNEYTKEKPPTEKELIRLQNDWLVNDRSQETLDPFFMTMTAYARSLTLKINKGRVYLAPSRVLEIAYDSVLKVFDRYKKDPDFKVESSFAGWVKYPILEQLYGSKQRKLDKIVSLNSMISYDNESELIDIQEKLKFASISSSDYGRDSKNDLQEIISIIMSVFNEMKSELSYRLQILFKVGLLLWMRRPRSRFCIPRFVKTFFTEQEEAVFEMFMLEVRNRIIGV